MKGIWCVSCLCLQVRGLLVSLSCFSKMCWLEFRLCVLFFFSFPGGTFSTRSMISSFLFMVSELYFERCIKLCASLALYTTRLGPYPLYAPTIALVLQAIRIFFTRLACETTIVHTTAAQSCAICCCVCPAHTVQRNLHMFFQLSVFYLRMLKYGWN